MCLGQSIPPSILPAIPLSSPPTAFYSNYMCSPSITKSTYPVTICLHVYKIDCLLVKLLRFSLVKMNWCLSNSLYIRLTNREEAM